mgnify:CR=1 FL=1
MGACTSAEENAHRLEITQERSVKNNEFVADGSPLVEEDLAGFSGLKYFPVDFEFRLAAILNPYSKAESVLLQQGDTLTRMPRYGKVVFTLHGAETSLTVFKPVKNPLSTEEDYLFVPFFDQTNTEETYEGGRYVYPEMQDDGSLIIDFNKASNPYCAYNHAFNCVVPPMENSIAVKINAGEKSYH